MKKKLLAVIVIAALAIGLGIGTTKVSQNADPGGGKPTDPTYFGV